MKGEKIAHDLLFFVAAAGAFLMSSCQSGGGISHVQYPDAVVSLNQVDPRYRPYFSAQHGANYGIEEQRNAFYAAQKTARTPVTNAGYAPPVRRGANKSTIIRKSKPGKAAPSKKRATRGRSSSPKRATRVSHAKKAPVRKKTTSTRKR